MTSTFVLQLKAIMFIRRRCLLWLIIVIGSSWVVISTYFVGSSYDSQTQKHRIRYVDRSSQSDSKKNYVKIDSAVSTMSVHKKEVSYDEYNEEEVINVPAVQENVSPRHTPISQSLQRFEAYDRAESEIELKNTKVRDHFEKKAEDFEVDNAPKSSVWYWKTELKPKVQEAFSPELTQRQKKKLTLNQDSVAQPPGKGYYTLIFVAVLC